jgi:hypothetical protein
LLPLYEIAHDEIHPVPLTITCCLIVATASLLLSRRAISITPSSPSSSIIAARALARASSSSVIISHISRDVLSDLDAARQWATNDSSGSRGHWQMVQRCGKARRHDGALARMMADEHPTQATMGSEG